MRIAGKEDEQNCDCVVTGMDFLVLIICNCVGGNRNDLRHLQKCLCMHWRFDVEICCNESVVSARLVDWLGTGKH